MDKLFYKLSAIASIAILSACAQLDIKSIPYLHDETEASDAELLLTATNDCDRSADPRFSSLIGSYPLSVYQKSARPSLGQLIDSKKITIEQKNAIFHYSSSTQKCNAQINYIVEKYFSPKFAKAWRNYNFLQSDIDQKLVKEQLTFGEANSRRYAAAVALSTELLEYRHTYKGPANYAGQNFRNLETCKRTLQRDDVAGLFTLLLNEQSRLVTGDVICADEDSQANPARQSGPKYINANN